jgi:glycine cleavage system regulatory protein
MAAHEVDITDLNTRLLSSESEPIYALMMEVALPEGLETATLEAELAEVSGEQGVEVSVKPLEVEAL